MKQEKYNLSWQSFSEHLLEMLHHMMISNEFTDVTLVSEDKQHFKAHKVVLSASSQVFKSIVTDLVNPLIYLRGVQSNEVESILQFIYLGEATLYQDRINEFFNVAKSLEMNEIKKLDPINNLFEDSEHAFEHGEEEAFDLKTEQEKRPLETNLNVVTMKGYCDKCDKQFSNQFSLDRHLKSVHEGVKYPCDQCNHKATLKDSLQKHIKAIHDGVKYPCLQCSYKASFQSDLLIHQKSVHKGVKYPCGKCNFVGSAASSLNHHIKSFHTGVKYPCNHCNFEGSTPSGLHKHKKSFHNTNYTVINNK